MEMQTSTCLVFGNMVLQGQTAISHFHDFLEGRLNKRAAGEGGGGFLRIVMKGVFDDVKYGIAERLSR